MVNINVTRDASAAETDIQERDIKTRSRRMQNKILCNYVLPKFVVTKRIRMRSTCTFVYVNAKMHVHCTDIHVVVPRKRDHECLFLRSNYASLEGSRCCVIGYVDR